MDLLLNEYTTEDVVDVLQLLVEIERPLDFLSGQDLGHIRVCQEQILER